LLDDEEEELLLPLLSSLSDPFSLDDDEADTFALPPAIFSFLRFFFVSFFPSSSPLLLDSSGELSWLSPLFYELEGRLPRIR
jgi:hypothetical protein